MSAYNQNYEYRFGQKKEDAKEKTLSKERLEEIKKSAEKYLNKDKNETKT